MPNGDGGHRLGTEEQCKQYRPRVVVVTDTKTFEEISEASLLSDLAIELLYGQDGLRELVSSEETDTIVAGITGAAGLESTYYAIIEGKKILVANKEPLVMAGSLLTKASSESGALILPIDSEHNAILQCLGTSFFELGKHPTVEKIFLTASSSTIFCRYPHLDDPLPGDGCGGGGGGQGAGGHRHHPGRPHHHRPQAHRRHRCLMDCHHSILTRAVNNIVRCGQSCGPGTFVKNLKYIFCYQSVFNN